MSDKENQNFFSLLHEFMSIMELPEFQEIDRRLSKLQLTTSHPSPTPTLITTQQFILTLLTHLTFVNENSYTKIRNALYKSLPKIKELIHKHTLTKKKLISILKHDEVRDMMSYFKYESGEEMLVYQLLDTIDDVLSTTPT